MTHDLANAPTDVGAALAAALMDSGATAAPLDDHPDVLSVFTHSQITHQLVDLEQFAAEPRRAKGTIKARTLAGVDQAIARHRPGRGRVALYHDAETLQVTAILNDDAGGNGLDQADTVGWRDHRIVWTPTLTPEWKHWVNGQGLHDQVRFAELLEDGEAEIAEPSAQDMLEIANTLHGTSSARYRAHGRPKTGITQFLFEETAEVKAGEKGDLSIPDVFVIVVRPFFGSDPYRVKARIRTRTNDGRLTIGYQLHRPDDVIRDAFDTHVAELIGALDDVDTIEGLPGS